MIRIAVAVLFVLHGLIHLFGFAKAFGLAEMPQLVQPISQPVGLLWLAAALLSCAAAAALFLTPRWWWAFGAAAVVISQAVIMSSWQDAKWGTIANVVLLVAVLYGFASRGPLSLRAEFEHDLAQAGPSAQSSGPVTGDDLAPPAFGYSGTSAGAVWSGGRRCATSARRGPAGSAAPRTVRG